MMRFAFSMPLFTPSATMKYVKAMKMSMKMMLSAPEVMKPEK